MSAHTKGPTLEQMHVAWLRRHKPRWPLSFEEAMEHPLYKRLLAIECLRAELRELALKDKPGFKVESMQSNRLVPAGKVGYWMDTDTKDDP